MDTNLRRFFKLRFLQPLDGISVYEKMASGGHCCCAASFCSNYKKKTPEISFFRFPRDAGRYV